MNNWNNEPISLGSKLLIHSIDGHRIFLDTNELHMTLHMIEHHVWEPQIREIISRTITEGSTYIDVGANIGLHSLYAAAFVGSSGKVICIEPNIRLMNLLKTNVEVNGFLNRFTFIDKAISDHIGLDKFYIYDGHASMSGFMAEHKDFKANKEILDIEVTTLDTIIKKEKVDLLKIDVEGFEYDVLKGAYNILSNPDITIIIEWNPCDIIERKGERTLDKTLDLFRKDNYKVYRAIFGKQLEKIDINGDCNDLKNTVCDLIFTKKSHLDSLLKIDTTEEDNYMVKGDENDKQKRNDTNTLELDHAIKAFNEAVHIQNELKKKIYQPSFKDVLRCIKTYINNILH